MAAATNAATYFPMILKGVTQKGSEVATSDLIFLCSLKSLRSPAFLRVLRDFQLSAMKKNNSLLAAMNK